MTSNHTQNQRLHGPYKSEAQASGFSSVCRHNNTRNLRAIASLLVPFRQFLILIIALLLLPTTVTAQTITEGMQKQLPSIINFLNEKNLKNVGVLKFRVTKANSNEASDSVGPMNSLLADRLELGLILANPFDESEQLNIIEGASDQVAKIQGANHLEEEGRRKLFDHNYTLAWGEEKVKADAFITGGVRILPDNVSAKVLLLYVSKNGGEVEPIGRPFDAELDPQSLSESGSSFTLRGAFDKTPSKAKFKAVKKQKHQAIKQQVARIKSQQTSFPLKDPTAPMQLEIRYDGQVVPVEIVDGEARVREPREGQKVELVLVRAAAAQGRLGAVLKVNGENTLYRSTIRDIDAPKWILSTEHPRTLVKGYQKNEDDFDRFVILSDEESKRRAMDYGRNVGQIQLTVFSEMSGPDPNEFILDENEEDLVAMFRGVLPAKQPKNLGALKHQIRLAGKSGPRTRGLIGSGKSGNNKIKNVKFKPDPTPLMSVTITYYK